jgi:hypothetical protein
MVGGSRSRGQPSLAFDVGYLCELDHRSVLVIGEHDLSWGAEDERHGRR